MRSRAGFGEDLAGVKLLCRSIVMVIGQNPGEQVDDGRITSMAVQSDMAARRYDRPAEAQFARFAMLSISVARSIAASTSSVTDR
jgi:hypothetical protein